MLWLRNNIAVTLQKTNDQLKIHKSVGHDNLPSYFLRTASHILAPASALCYHFNYALQLGIFPASCKIARVVPIFKNGKKDQGRYVMLFVRIRRFFVRHVFVFKTAVCELYFAKKFCSGNYNKIFFVFMLPCKKCSLSRFVQQKNLPVRVALQNQKSS